MTEYWKSIPKKYCDACKCWFQDNKASIDFHERGSRHKINMEMKIRDSLAKGKSNQNAKSGTDLDMQKIEAAAMAAYAKDVASNPSLVKSYGTMPSLVKPSASKSADSSKGSGSSILDSIPLLQATPSTSSWTDPKPSDAKLILGQEKALDAITTKQKKMLLAAAARKWQEAKSEDDFSYFYNSETGETRWDAPAEGYVSLADQMKDGEKDSEAPVPALRTKPLMPALDSGSSSGALGGWTTVTPKEAMGLPDLGLIAAPRNAAAELANEMHTTAAEHEVSRIQFKTKTISSFGPPGGEGQEAEFKKRKFGGDSKRQVRKREE